MLQNSWSIKLSESPTHTTIAKFPQPSIVYQGTSNQLSVYTNNKTENLPIRKEVLSLATINTDNILILTRYNLACFDFLSNEEKFTIEFQNAEKMEVINNKIYVICGSSLYCYDFNGEQVYVNHISANIATLTKVEMQSEKGGIVIATNDMTMARYTGLNISFDYAKIVGTATSLCWIGKGVMVGTKEGTIAYYESKKSKWKAKSSHAVLKILKYSQNKSNQLDQSDGIEKFSSGEGQKIYVLRQNGNIQYRDWTSGGTLSKIKCGQDIRQGFITDFRKQGYEQIMVILASGTVRAFNFVDSATQGVQKKHQDHKKNIVGQQAINQNMEIEHYQKIKTQLMYEITKLKESLAGVQEQGQEQQILHSDFKMKAVLEYEEGLNLIITSTQGYISGITFEQPIMPILVEKTQQFKYKFRNSNESAGEIVCEVLVHSSSSSSKYLVRSLKIFLPKFWKWGLDPKVRKQIGGKLRFKMIQRNARYLKWIKQCFFINISEKQEQKLEGLSVMKLRFFNWYQNQQMEILFYQKQGVVEVCCDCLKTMGQIVQDLVNYVGLKNLNTELFFPKQKQRIKQILNTVERLSQAKVSISSDMAESINTIKFLLVKGESSRQVGSMNSFRKTYAEVMEQNRSLITQIQKKNMNTKTLSEAMKSVGNFINQIANVRFGESKNLVISKCREAIKKKDFPIIIDIMAKGVDLAENQ